MRDGRTRQARGSQEEASDFLAKHRASLTIVRGPAAGTEIELGAMRTLVGRSESACLRIDEASVSHEHAAIELDAKGFGVRDLGSTNGISVNGSAVEAATLEHGDRIGIGDCELQFVLEQRRDGGGRRWLLGRSGA